MSNTVDQITATINPNLPFGRPLPAPFSSGDSGDQQHILLQLLTLESVPILKPGAMGISFARRPHAATFQRRPQAFGRYSQ